MRRQEVGKRKKDRKSGPHSALAKSFYVDLREKPPQNFQFEEQITQKERRTAKKREAKRPFEVYSQEVVHCGPPVVCKKKLLSSLSVNRSSFQHQIRTLSLVSERF